VSQAALGSGASQAGLKLDIGDVRLDPNVLGSRTSGPKNDIQGMRLINTRNHQPSEIFVF
jgi:hypothetical protein